MKSKALLFFLLSVILIYMYGCGKRNSAPDNQTSVRELVDTVGFAQYSWQMDTLMDRLDHIGWVRPGGSPWKLAICPHDDYTYVGVLYPELLSNVKAKNLILIGVAHKAASLGIEDSLVFDSFNYWKGPWGNVKVSQAREEIFNQIKGSFAIVNDTLQKVEHSLESMIPFLQYFNKDIKIIPILVPSMSVDRMQACGRALADAIKQVAVSNKWEWGRDYSIIATTDAVHYGNEDWGGADYAFFGCDSAGNVRAREHEYEIIDSCLTGKVTPAKIRLFNSYTLNSDNYKIYKWTWCGRYSVPVALYTAYYLNDSIPLDDELIGYSTSITSNHIPVSDIRMGVTAIATDCHWVGYAAIGYR
jgi:AmmeMemoRadiSam system protein B